MRKISSFHVAKRSSVCRHKFASYWSRACNGMAEGSNSNGQNTSQPWLNIPWSLGHNVHPSGIQNLTNNSRRRLQEDLQHVIRGIGPLVEGSAPFGSMNANNLTSWLRQQQPSLFTRSNSRVNANITSPLHVPTQRDTADFVINVDNDQGRSTSQRTPASNGNATLNGSARDSDPAEALQNNPEMRALLSIAGKYVPFLLILLLKLIFDHRIGILVVIGLFATFCHANSVIKREVAKQGKRHLISLLIIASNLTTCIAFVYLVLAEDNLPFALILIPPYTRPVAIWEVLWIVTVTDYVLKLLTILLKAVVVALPARVITFQKKGKYYLLLETCSQFYRSVAPVQHWLYFFSESYHGSSKVFGVILSAVYLVFKCKDVVRKLRALRKAVNGMLQSVTYGVAPSADQLKAAGESCPICQDDYRTPTMLQCKHIFCEECVSIWFDRERTCPMCRAEIADDPSWRDGSTTFILQVF